MIRSNHAPDTETPTGPTANATANDTANPAPANDPRPRHHPLSNMEVMDYEMEDPQDARNRTVVPQCPHAGPSSAAPDTTFNQHPFSTPFGESSSSTQPSINPQSPSNLPSANYATTNYQHSFVVPGVGGQPGPFPPQYRSPYIPPLNLGDQPREDFPPAAARPTLQHAYRNHSMDQTMFAHQRARFSQALGSPPFGSSSHLYPQGSPSSSGQMDAHGRFSMPPSSTSDGSTQNTNSPLPTPHHGPRGLPHPSEFLPTRLSGINNNNNNHHHTGNSHPGNSHTNNNNNNNNSSNTVPPSQLPYLLNPMFTQPTQSTERLRPPPYPMGYGNLPNPPTTSPYSFFAYPGGYPHRLDQELTARHDNHGSSPRSNQLRGLASPPAPPPGLSGIVEGRGPYPPTSYAGILTSPDPQTRLQSTVGQASNESSSTSGTAREGRAPTTSATSTNNPAPHRDEDVALLHDYLLSGHFQQSVRRSFENGELTEPGRPLQDFQEFVEPASTAGSRGNALAIAQRDSILRRERDRRMAARYQAIPLPLPRDPSSGDGLLTRPSRSGSPPPLPTTRASTAETFRRMSEMRHETDRLFEDYNAFLDDERDVASMIQRRMPHDHELAILLQQHRAPYISHHGPRRATAKAIENLEKVELSTLDHDDRSCSICMEPFGEPEPTEGKIELPVKLPCGHVFGLTCIKTWLKDHCTCPSCRRKLESESVKRAEGGATHRRFVANARQAAQRASAARMDEYEGEAATAGASAVPSGRGPRRRRTSDVAVRLSGLRPPRPTSGREGTVPSLPGLVGYGLPGMDSGLSSSDGTDYQNHHGLSFGSPGTHHHRHGHHRSNTTLGSSGIVGGSSSRRTGGSSIVTSRLPGTLMPPTTNMGTPTSWQSPLGLEPSPGHMSRRSVTPALPVADIESLRRARRPIRMASLRRSPVSAMEAGIARARPAAAAAANGGNGNEGGTAATVTLPTLPTSETRRSSAHALGTDLSFEDSTMYDVLGMSSESEEEEEES
ncbi:MAG: hypothetical protein M1823_003004 [Watsoniomyces obsoletus]|nr:MAG: hypothetical protein M1823_003004 [Watsoniomyces obsoletus]